MKNYRLWNWSLSALIAFSFFACDNEPLEGEFITDDGVEVGGFTASVNGEFFEAQTTSGQLSNGVLLLSGIDSSGNIIALTISNVGECTFDLTSAFNISSFILNGQINDPYLTTAALGGSGTATIDSYDADALTVSGTFSFTGVREISDGAGGTTTESIVVSSGVFDSIPFSLINGSAEPNACDPNGGGGGTGVTDPDDSFYALVDGEEFVDTDFVSEEIMVGSNNIVKVTATNAAGAQIQFFIPPNLGVGTYDFEPIFNGSNLTVTYISADGSESLTSSSGSITFNEFGLITGKIGATFSFTGTDPVGGSTTVIEVTEGVFNIDYLPSSGTTENIFTASIDGEDYVPNTIEIVLSPFQGKTLVNVTTINETTNQSVSLVFPIDITVGNFDMSPFPDTGEEIIGIFNPDIGTSILFKSDPGVFTVTSYQYGNGVIEGSFVFSAIDPLGNNPNVYQITNGFFTLTIP